MLARGARYGSLVTFVLEVTCASDWECVEIYRDEIELNRTEYKFLQFSSAKRFKPKITIAQSVQINNNLTNEPSNNKHVLKNFIVIFCLQDIYQRIFWLCCVLFVSSFGNGSWFKTVFSLFSFFSWNDAVRIHSAKKMHFSSASHVLFSLAAWRKVVLYLGGSTKSAKMTKLNEICVKTEKS